MGSIRTELEEMEKYDRQIAPFKRCDNIIHLEDTKDDPLKDDNILVKIYFKRMESHLQSFESTISLLDRFDKSSIENKCIY